MAIAFGGTIASSGYIVAQKELQDLAVAEGTDRYFLSFCASGLFLADEPAMNQLAFFFVTSVLVDTFITRTILVRRFIVPITMECGDKARFHLSCCI